MKVTVARRFTPAVDESECRHGLLTMTCVLCNGRPVKTSRPKANPLRLEDLLEDATPAEAAIFAITTTRVAQAAGVGTAIAAPEPAKCECCPRRAAAGNHRAYRRDPVRPGPLGKGFTNGAVGDRWLVEVKVNAATHRVKGKAICDECCHKRGECQRCKNLVPERYTGRRATNRQSHSASAVAIDSLFS